MPPILVKFITDFGLENIIKIFEKSYDYYLTKASIITNYRLIIWGSYVVTKIMELFWAFQDIYPVNIFEKQIDYQSDLNALIIVQSLLSYIVWGV